MVQAVFGSYFWNKILWLVKRYCAIFSLSRSWRGEPVFLLTICLHWENGEKRQIRLFCVGGKVSEQIIISPWRQRLFSWFMICFLILPLTTIIGTKVTNYQSLIFQICDSSLIHLHLPWLNYFSIYVDKPGRIRTKRSRSWAACKANLRTCFQNNKQCHFASKKKTRFSIMWVPETCVHVFVRKQSICS